MRVVISALVLVLPLLGFLVGYWVNHQSTSPKGTNDTRLETSENGKEPTKSTPAEEKQPFRVGEVRGAFGSMMRQMGAAEAIHYQGGPAWVHVQYYVDFQQEGVKKRAYFQAFNVRGRRDDWAGDQELSTDGYFDESESDGIIALDKKQLLRTARTHRIDKRQEKGHKWSSTTLSSRDVFDWYLQVQQEPKPVLVLEFEKCTKTVKDINLITPSFSEGESSGTIISSIPSMWARFFRSSKANFAGQEGIASLEVFLRSNLVLDPLDEWRGKSAKAPATLATCDKEITAVRQRLAANPTDGRSAYLLASALDHKRSFLKAKNPEAEYPLAEEAAGLVREATKTYPGDMFLRAELRHLLLRQAGIMVEGKQAAEFPKIFEELLSLVPLYDAEYTSAADLLRRWKNPELQKDLPEAQKKQLIAKTDLKVVKLLRHYAEIWQNHPEEIKKQLQSYEKDAAGKSYAETPEFKSLLDEMRKWSGKGK